MLRKHKPTLKDKLFGPKKSEGIVGKVEKIIRKRSSK